MSRTGKSLSKLLVLGQLLLLSGTAHAEDPAAAEALFQEGRRLLADGQVSTACEKFKESFSLDPMSGTLLNLAACYEQDGRTATAWARFRNAATLAKNQGKTEQAAEANRRVKALEANLSYMTIVVPEAVPGLEVTRNDAEVTQAAFGVEVPVDPGHVEVVASAPGYKTVRLTAEIGARRDKQTVTIPRLTLGDNEPVADKPPARTAATELPPSVKSDETPKEGGVAESAAKVQEAAPPMAEKPVAIKGGPGVMPWIVGGLGVAAVATGGVFGFMAMKSDEDANSLCPTRHGCSKKAVTTAELRDEQALVATIGVGVGLAGIASAVVWLLVDKPKKHDDSAALVLQPVVARGTAALWAQGRF